jgi:uncharacterized membrane protein
VPSYPQRGIFALVLVNLALQAFDGAATYLGLQAGFHEGNPLLVWALHHIGPASTLFLFKLQACAWVLVLWRLRRHSLAAPALALSAAIYVVCSLAPWTMALAGLHGDLDWYLLS